MTVDTPDYVGFSAQHHGKLTMFSNLSQVIAANATYSAGNIPFTKPGYWIFLNSVVAAVTANPFMLVTAQWRDTITGNTLDQQEWVCPAGTSAVMRTSGRGPVTGDELHLTIQNLDAAQSMTIKLLVIETTHAIARHDWRSNMNTDFQMTGVSFFNAPCSVFSGSLFQGTPSIPATSVNSYIMGLYAGQVWLSETDTGATGLTVAVKPSQTLDSATGTPQVFSGIGSAAGLRGTLTLPRQPCVVTVTNPNAGPVVCNLNIGITELAS